MVTMTMKRRKGEWYDDDHYGNDGDHDGDDDDHDDGMLSYVKVVDFATGGNIGRKLVESKWKRCRRGQIREKTMLRR